MSIKQYDSASSRKSNSSKEDGPTNLRVDGPHLSPNWNLACGECCIKHFSKKCPFYNTPTHLSHQEAIQQVEPLYKDRIRFFERKL